MSRRSLKKLGIRKIKTSYRLSETDSRKGRPLFSREIRDHVYLRFDKHCSYCGVSITYRRMTIDHVLPRCRGGSDEIDNLYPSCYDCNDLKGFETLEEFRLTFARRFSRSEFYFETFEREKTQ